MSLHKHFFMTYLLIERSFQLNFIKDLTTDTRVAPRWEADVFSTVCVVYGL